MTLEVFAPQQLWRQQVFSRLGDGSIGVSGTTGFMYVPTAVVATLGVPAIQAGMLPIVVDSATGKLYTYFGGNWILA